MPAKLLMNWIKKFGKKWLGDESRRQAARRRPATRRRPTIEILEDRITPTTWLVTLATDSATPTAGMLRYAINNSVAGDTITFASNLSPATIDLTGTLSISHNLTITGFASSANLVLYGKASFVDIIVNAGVTASISGLSVENGLSGTGGGIQNLGTLSLSNATISGNGSLSNTTNQYGAGISNRGTMDINGCTITNNATFTDGGGIYNAGTLTVTDSSVCGNYAYTFGGGIYNTGTLALANDTISGNAGWDGSSSLPEDGGGISNSGTLTMANTLVSGNTASNNGPQIFGAVAAASTNNFVSNGSGMTGISNGLSGNLVGTGASPLNPLLGALADNGGPTATESLGAGSPAIAAGAAVTSVGMAGIAATGNSIVLTNGALIGNTTGLHVFIQIDSEQMLVTGVSGNTLTVIRGYNGTTPATHAAGTGVYLDLDQRGYATTSPTTPDIGAYQSTGAAPATPTVTGTLPSAGSPAGGTTVTVNGTNLQFATAVYFGSQAGTIVSDSGTSVVATTPAESAGTVDTTVTTVGWDTSPTSPADEFIYGPSYAESLDNGVLSITQESPSINGDLNFALSGGNYTFTDSNGYLFDVPTGASAASITGAGTNTITIPSAAVTSISVVLGAGTHIFNFTGTGGAAAAPIVVNTGTSAGDEVNFTGAVLDSGAVNLTTNAIGESGSGSLSTTDTLTTNSVTGTVLAANASAIGTFNATNSGVGDINLLDSATTLVVSGITDTAAGGAVTVSNTSGALSLTGAVNASSNAVTLTAATTLTQTASPVVSAGTLDLTAGSIGSGSQSLVFSAAALTTDTTSGPNGSQFLADTGTVGLAAANALNAGSGTVTLTEGTFQVQSADAIADTVSLTANNPATLDLDGFDETIAALNGSGSVIDSGAAATLTVTGGGLFSGSISGASTGLTVDGAGQTLTLSSTNSYGGATQVEAGQLVVDGSVASSAVTVSGGVLGGSGAVGAITATGGTVAPDVAGGSPTVLTAASANFSSSADLTLGIAAFTSAGAGYDQLNLGGGALTLGASSVLTLDLAGLNSSGTAYNIIAYGSESGAFTTVNLIDNPHNFQDVLTYTATGLNVTIVSAATHFQVTGLSGSVVAGTPLTVTVTALDAYGNVAALYTGTIQFTTTDPSNQVVLPTNYTFTTGAMGDNGVHTFTGLTQLVTAGMQTVTATDTVNAGVTGMSGSVLITPSTADQLVITQQPSSTATAGVAFNTQPVVQEEDAFGNVITTDSTSTVTVARGNLGSASLQGSPLTVTLASGVATFSGISYNVAETINLSFTTTAGNFTATSNDITIAGPPSITAMFGAPTVVLNGTTTLSFTISNSNLSTALSGVGFTDVLPAGLVVATPSGLSNSSPGGGTATAVAGSNSITLTGAAVPANGSITFLVDVLGTTAGLQNDSTGPVTSNEGGSGNPDSASVTVTPVLTPASTLLTTTTTTLTIDGFGFDSNSANDHVVFSGNATGTISAATATTLTVTGLMGLNVGPLFATVTVDGAASNQAEVATVSSDVVITDNTPGDTLTLMQTTGTGTVGDITYVLGSQPPVTLTGVTSFTYNATARLDTMIVDFPASTGGVLVTGSVTFINGSGAASTLIIEANGLPVQSHSGSFVVGDPQTVNYSNIATTNINGASSVNVIYGPDTSDRATAFTSLTAQEHFVQALYLDELGRAGIKSELNGWVQVLDSTSATQVAFDIAHSEEASEHLVQTWYQSFLGRAAGDGEELGFVNELMQGASEESVLSGILASTEFFNRAQTLVATGTPQERFVQSLYQLLLGRTGTASEIASWVGVLPQQGQAGVALNILESSEFRAYLVEGYYNALLHRPADTAGLESWASSDQDALTLRIGIESSGEFFTNG